MKVISTTDELIAFRRALDSTNSCIGIARIGLVPTMGALHKGHLSLITRSTKENTHTIVSIFVNPTQFLPNEDLSTYPRQLESDLRLCEENGVSAVFAPHINEMYQSQNEVKILAPSTMAYILEGFARPGHFDGVLQIVLKLFCLTRPHNAYFGQKDAQQLLIIKQMVQNLFLPITINPCPIVRDDDGLALSSRNIYLSPQERHLALALPKAINAIQKAYQNGETSCEILVQIGLEQLQHIQVEYLQACNHSLESITTIIPNQSLFLLCARIGKTRLLDNLWI